MLLCIRKDPLHGIPYSLPIFQESGPTAVQGLGGPELGLGTKGLSGSVCSCPEWGSLETKEASPVSQAHRAAIFALFSYILCIPSAFHLSNLCSFAGLCSAQSLGAFIGRKECPQFWDRNDNVFFT